MKKRVKPKRVKAKGVVAIALLVDAADGYERPRKVKKLRRDMRAGRNYETKS